MRILRKIVALSVLPGVMITGYALGRVSDNVPQTSSAVVLMGGPSEDSRNFNCARHGNRMCGVKVDLTPNKKGGVRRYVLDFKVNPKGDAVAVVRPFGPGTR